MPRLAALLRGINLGSSHKLPMADVRAAFEAEGASDVVTLLNSGNVVFTHDERSTVALERRLAAALERKAGFAVPVMVRTRPQLRRVLDGNPFPKATPKQLHVTFLAGKPPAAAVGAIDEAACAPEAFVIANREIYLYLPNGMGRSLLPGRLNALQTPGTTRTWQTVTKLADLVGA